MQRTYQSAVSEAKHGTHTFTQFWRFKFGDKCAPLTLLHTPVELRQDVVEQHVAQCLEILGEDVADGVKCVIAGGGHPLGFLQGGRGSTRAVSSEVLKQTLGANEGDG